MAELRTAADLVRELDAGTYCLQDVYRLAEQRGLADRPGARDDAGDGQAKYKRNVRAALYAEERRQDRARRTGPATWLVEGTAERPRRALLIWLPRDPGRVELMLGDATRVLAEADEPIDLVFADPPWGLARGDEQAAYQRVYRRDRSKVMPGYEDVPDSRYTAFTADWVTAAVAALRPGGYLAAVAGPQRAARIQCAAEEAGLTYVNSITVGRRFGVYCTHRLTHQHYVVSLLTKGPLDSRQRVFEDHARSSTLNFTFIPPALRQATKFYIWQLLNHSRTRGLRSANNARLAVHSIELLFTGQLQFVLAWFAERGVTEFGQITQDLLDGYLDALRAEEVPVERCYRRITEIRRLWAHRDLLPASMRMPEAPPWAGDDTRDLMGRTRGGRENRTRRIGEVTMQMLLRWALRFLEDFSGDILAAYAEHLTLAGRSPEQRRRAGGAHPRWKSGELQQEAVAYLQDLRRRGEPLPGVRRDDGQVEIRWRHVAARLNCSNSVQYTATGRLIVESGLPIGECTYLDTPVTALLDGKPWTGRINFDDAPRLARLLSTACFIVIAYLSGARVGEKRAELHLMQRSSRRNCPFHAEVTASK